MRSACFILLFIFTVTFPAFAGEKKVVLSSLLWPPYSGEQLEREGASIAVARAAFEAVGYRLEVRYFPWKRTVLEAKEDSDIIGFLPEYYSEERGREFLFSDRIGISEVGLAELVPMEIHWDSLDDLSKYTIGTVRGYINLAEFDAKVANGELHVDESVDDVTNLRKLLNERVALSVVDTNVFEYLLKNDGMLTKHKAELVLNPRLLITHDLYVCFLKSDEGVRLHALFNQGLSLIDPLSLQEEHLKRVFKGR